MYKLQYIKNYTVSNEIQIRSWEDMKNTVEAMIHTIDWHQLFQYESKSVFIMREQYWKYTYRNIQGNIILNKFIL